MTEKHFNPHVRYIEKILAKRPYPEMICAYDFRMFFVVKGTFCVEFRNNEIKLSAGDLLTIPPGIEYRLIYGSKVDVKYYILNFDFDSRLSHKPALAPVAKNKFDKREIFSVKYVEPFGEIFVLHNVDILEQTVEEICDYDKDGTWHNKSIQSALMKYLLSKAAAMSENRIKGSKTEALMREVKNYIEQNFSGSITNKAVAEYFGYHPYHLNSLFLKAEKITLHKHIENIRLKKAKEMLIMTDKPVYEIAFACGFSDASYFCKFFVRGMGITPGEYRNLSK